MEAVRTVEARVKLVGSRDAWVLDPVGRVRLPLLRAVDCTGEGYENRGCPFQVFAKQSPGPCGSGAGRRRRHEQHESRQ